jgi:CRP-like cAMP-binding protein
MPLGTSSPINRVDFAPHREACVRPAAVRPPERSRCAEPATKATRHLTVAPRSTVFDEGEDAASIYFVVEGAVLLSKLLPDGRRQIIECLGPGDMFGMTSTTRHDVCAETLLRTRLASYDRRCISESYALQVLVAERLRAQICHLHDHALLLGRKSALERVATFLMSLVLRRDGLDRTLIATNIAQVCVPLRRQDIADYLGLSLETVSRAFSQLRRDGLLAYVRSDAVTINDVSHMRRLCGEV